MEKSITTGEKIQNALIKRIPLKCDKCGLDEGRQYLGKVSIDNEFSETVKVVSIEPEGMIASMCHSCGKIDIYSVKHLIKNENY